MNIPEVYVDTNVAASHVQRRKFDRVCLVDADFLKYNVTYDIFKWIEQHKVHPGEKYGDSYLEKFTFDRIDNTLMKYIDAKAFVFLFSASSNSTFRYQVGFAKEYKGNRRGKPDAYDYEGKSNDMRAIMTIISEKYPVMAKPNLEADDLISVLQNEHTFIYSMDKDLKQIPGMHYDMSTGNLEEITHSKALMSLCYQMLAGDSTDNIPGYPMMGEKKTMDFLQSMGNVKDIPFAIFKHYAKNFGIFNGIDMFCENWMLLKLRGTRGDHFMKGLESEINLLKHLIEN